MAGGGGGRAWAAGSEEEPGSGAEVGPGGSSLRGRGLSLDDIVVVTCDVTVTTEDLSRREWIKVSEASQVTDRLGVT